MRKRRVPRTTSSAGSKSGSHCLQLATTVSRHPVTLAPRPSQFMAAAAAQLGATACLLSWTLKLSRCALRVVRRDRGGGGALFSAVKPEEDVGRLQLTQGT